MSRFISLIVMGAVLLVVVVLCLIFRKRISNSRVYLWMKERGKAARERKDEELHAFHSKQAKKYCDRVGARLAEVVAKQ